MSDWNNFKPKHRRRVLLVFPRYAKSFGTFDHAFALLGVRAFMPPQGVLLIAALLPREWDIKFVDENVRPVRSDELDWADVVFLSGMHVQRARINELNQRAHRSGKLTVLGGPSVSAARSFTQRWTCCTAGKRETPQGGSSSTWTTRRTVRQNNWYFAPPNACR